MGSNGRGALTRLKEECTALCALITVVASSVLMLLSCLATPFSVFFFFNITPDMEHSRGH
ncbi:hypothetical protein Pla52o_53870 [Novipirellula galeiformis]|uniref:Uncharacterized protein n=1 Tax=Novipirellula galeiformis TaxID=2528004 RepID=A0A5C6BZC8_9BACT|nr:hypothetical protein Pla52o_53870 [Novipirellula galeiformis]